MTDKHIIDGIDVRKCKHFKALYESRPNGFGGITIENYCYLYEDNCEKYPQCLYRSNQLQQLETQLKRKEEAIDEIEKQVKAMNNECFYDDICDCNNCDMKSGCSYYRKFNILNIINKIKDGFEE